MPDQPPSVGRSLGEGPVLDLNTLIQRPKIAIDGKLYEILSPDEVSPLQYQRLGIRGRRLDALLERPILTDGEEIELGELVDMTADEIMVGVPKKLRQKLSGAQKLDVIEVFTRLPKQRRMLAAAKAIQSIGAQLPPGFNASTAGPPDGGSTTPRSPSSAPTS